MDGFRRAVRHRVRHSVVGVEVVREIGRDDRDRERQSRVVRIAATHHRPLDVLPAFEFEDRRRRLVRVGIDQPVRLDAVPLVVARLRLTSISAVLGERTSTASAAGSAGSSAELLAAGLDTAVTGEASLATTVPSGNRVGS